MGIYYLALCHLTSMGYNASENKRGFIVTYVFIGVIHSYLDLLLLFSGRIQHAKVAHLLLGHRHPGRKYHGQDGYTLQRCTPPGTCFLPLSPTSS